MTSEGDMCQRTTAGLIARVAIGLLVCAAPAAAQERGAGDERGLRLVSLIPQATEVVFELGLGDRLLGVGTYDLWPPEAQNLPRVGGLIDPDDEGILALRPDLVVVDPAQDRLVRQLTAVGIDTFAWPTAGIAGLLERIEAFGAVVGAQEQALALNQRIRTDLEEVRRQGAARPAREVLMVFGRREGSFAELWVNGGVGFLNDLLEIVGVRNVFGDIGRPSFKSGLEAVMARVPDLVIELRTAGQVDDSAADIEREWRSVPGFDGMRVIVIRETWMTIPGPRVVEAARRLAEELGAAS